MDEWTTQTGETVMHVADYRDLIDGLSQAFASLKSAASPQERLQAADWVRRSARELLGADCPRARQSDLDRAVRLIDQTASYLVAAGLDAPTVRLEKWGSPSREWIIPVRYRAGDWPRIQPGETMDDLDEVTVACACPQCGERRMDCLVWNEEELVECTTCGQVYDPNEQGE
jgi:rubredoxin